MSAIHKWPKGVSGNPSGKTKDGRPRKKPRKIPPGPTRDEMTLLARSHGQEVLDRLLFWARSKISRVSVRACQILLERGYGAVMPADRIESTLVLRGDKASGSEDIKIVLVRPILTEVDGEQRVVH